jgi:hypothetical protein
MPELSPLEKAMLSAMCKETSDDAHAISSQMSSLSILRRENTGAGFYSYFDGMRSGPPIKQRTISPDVSAKIKGLKNPMVFVLFSREGKLDMLEGAAVDEDTADVDFFSAEFKLC